MKISLFIALMPLFVIISCTPVPGNAQQQIAQNNSQISSVEQTPATPDPTATSSIQEPTDVQATTTVTATAEQIATVLPTSTQTSSRADTPTSSTATSTATVTTPLNNADLAAEGLRVYKAQYCGLCHQLDAADTKGLFGPAHNQVATHAAQSIAGADYTGNATDPAGYIRESILQPEIYLVEGFEFSRHRMPAYTHLSNAEVEALVQFLLQQQ